MRNDCDLAWGERRHLMIEPLERETVQIDEIAGNMQLGDLALGIGKVAHPCSPAVDQQSAEVEVLAARAEYLVGPHPPGVGDGAANGIFLLGADVVTLAELGEMGLDHGPSMFQSRNGCGATGRARKMRGQPWGHPRIPHFR